MNIVLLITVTLALTLVHGNDQPCQRNPNNNVYNRFIRRHILREKFNRTSRTSWESYIRTYGLCNRPKQTFIRGREKRIVLRTCNGYGRRTLLNSNQGNLCISDRTMLVYELTINNNCRVQSLVEDIKRVIVACDVVGNQCRPVHLEKSTTERPDTRAERCRPRG